MVDEIENVSSLMSMHATLLHFVCGFTKEMYFICSSSHWYSIPCGDDPIGPELVTFLRVFSMGEGMNVDVHNFSAGS